MDIDLSVTVIRCTTLSDRISGQGRSSVTVALKRYSGVSHNANLHDQVGAVDDGLHTALGVKRIRDRLGDVARSGLDLVLSRTNVVGVAAHPVQPQTPRRRAL